MAHFRGEYELIGGPLDGQVGAISVPEEEGLDFDSSYLPLPMNVFPGQIKEGMRLVHYRPERTVGDRRFYRFDSIKFS